tara:strand:- start:119 stop:796 length:678 start_codon:yes stop_codon:yes gene_type:complete
MPKKQKDLLITLAWPEGMVTASGAWYDNTYNPFLSKDNKYRVGHSAIVLVDSINGKCHYLDFGRYHTPKNKGRVRDEETDHDVKIDTIAIIENHKITNIKELLHELFKKESTHGDGALYAAVLPKVDFKKAYVSAKKMQDKGMITYGPFTINGTNCSRFVSTIIQKSNPGWIKKIRLKFPFCVTPSPKRNVSITNNNYYVVKKDLFKLVKKTKIHAYFSSIETWK